MITFKQFLLEERQELADFIRENCPKYVQEYQENTVLPFRGSDAVMAAPFNLNGKPWPASIQKTRKNRAPLNTPRAVHEFLDNWFFEKFGVKARSQTVFAFPFIETAKGFGVTSVVIPIGDYKVIWSRKVDDLTVEIYPDNSGSVKSTDVIGGIDVWQSPEGNTPVNIPDTDEQLQALERIMNALNYEMTDGFDYRMQRQELMIVCDSYLQIRCSATDIKTIREMLGEL